MDKNLLTEKTSYLQGLIKPLEGYDDIPESHYKAIWDTLSEIMRIIKESPEQKEKEQQNGHSKPQP